MGDCDYGYDSDVGHGCGDSCVLMFINKVEMVVMLIRLMMVVAI